MRNVIVCSDVYTLQCEKDNASVKERVTPWHMLLKNLKNAKKSFEKFGAIIFF